MLKTDMDRINPKDTSALVKSDTSLRMHIARRNQILDESLQVDSLTPKSAKLHFSSYFLSFSY